MPEPAKTGDHAGPPETPNAWIRDPRTRNYLFKIASVVVPLLVTVGVVSDTLAGHIIAIAAAVLGLAAPAMAAANTPR